MADFDFSTLITDRGQSDLATLRSVLSTPMEDWTAEQLAAFNQAASKGAYNYTDLNRVTACMDYLNERLTALGYVTGYERIVVHPENAQDLNTLLLLHGGDFLDASSYHRDLTNAGTLTAAVPGSLNPNVFNFPGSGKIFLDQANYLDFDSSDFTIEWREYIPATMAGGNAFAFLDNAPYWIMYYTADNIIQTWMGTPYAGTVVDSYALNQWTHRALVRHGNTLTLYRNGISVWSGAYEGDAPYSQTEAKCIGGRGFAGSPYDSQYFVGYMEEFRISNVARWTGNFTPPSEPYPDPPQDPAAPYIWDEIDVPTASQMEQYRKNNAALRSVLTVPDTAPAAPESMDALTQDEANSMEAILLLLEDLINKMSAAWFYSGDVYSGEVYA